MKAAMLKAIGQLLTLEDIPEPVPAAGEVLVRVLATPVLAYAQEVFSGERAHPLVLPLAPGGGAIGLVEKTGPDATQLQPGQLVFCDPMIRSRDGGLTPDSMLQGWIAQGEGAQKLQTYFRNGSFAEKVLVPLENAAPLTQMDSMDPVKLTWLGTLLVAYGWLAGCKRTAWTGRNGQWSNWPLRQCRGGAGRRNGRGTRRRTRTQSGRP